MINPADNHEGILLRQLQQNNEQALAVLMKKYYADLYNYASRFGNCEMQVKDAIQEVFISLWHRRQSAVEIVSLRFYLLKAVKNRMLKDQQKAAKREVLQGFSNSYGFNIEFSKEQKIIQEQILQNTSEQLTKMLLQLPARQKEIIFLKFYLQLDNEQIADLMGITRQSVYNLLYESLQKLKHLCKPGYALAYF